MSTATDRLVATLQTVQLFADLPGEALAWLAREMEVVVVTAGRRVVVRGQAGTSMFVVAEGALEATVDDAGRPVVVAALGPGEWFGEIELITGDARSATVVALTDSVLLELRGERFVALGDRHPVFLRQVSRTLCRRLVQATEALAAATQVYERMFGAVIAALDDDSRHLLLRLSLAEYPHPDVLASLCAGGETGPALARLSRQHPALVVSREDGTYRLHPRFRQYLRDRLLSAYDGETVAGIHEALALACQARGAQVEALRHWLAAGRLAEAAQVLARMVAARTTPGDGELGIWLAQLPVLALVEHGLVRTKAAWLRRQDCRDEVVALYRDALALVPSDRAVRRELLRDLADEYLHRGEVEQATACLAERDGRAVPSSVTGREQARS